MTFRNQELARLVPGADCRLHDLSRVEAALTQHQTLAVVRLPSGSMPLPLGADATVSSGYGNVWVRDNVFVAYAHDVKGSTRMAADAGACSMPIVSACYGADFSAAARSRIERSRCFISIDRSRRSRATGRAQNSITFGTTSTFPIPRAAAVDAGQPGPGPESDARNHHPHLRRPRARLVNRPVGLVNRQPGLTKCATTTLAVLAPARNFLLVMDLRQHPGTTGSGRPLALLRGVPAGSCGQPCI